MDENEPCCRCCVRCIGRWPEAEDDTNVRPVPVLIPSLHLDFTSFRFSSLSSFLFADSDCRFLFDRTRSPKDCCIQSRRAWRCGPGTPTTGPIPSTGTLSQFTHKGENKGGGGKEEERRRGGRESEIDITTNTEACNNQSLAKIMLNNLIF